MIYASYFFAAVPVALQAIANAVAAAMWVQSGDNHSFDFLTLQDAQSNLFCAVYSGCTDEFAATLPYLASNPQALHDTVAMVLARDWPEIAAPNQAEISLFCGVLKLSVNASIEDALTSTSLRAVI